MYSSSLLSIVSEPDPVASLLEVSEVAVYIFYVFMFIYFFFFYCKQYIMINLYCLLFNFL